MKILFLISSLKYGGAAKQLSLLAPGLPRDRFEPRVCVLGSAGPMGKVLKAAGVPVDALGWTRLFDVRPLWRLQRLLQSSRPDLIHVLDLEALRALRWILRGKSVKVIAGGTLGPGGSLSFWDRWLLGRADRIAVTGPAQAERCRGLGMSLDKLSSIPPGVGLGDVPLPSGEKMLGLSGIAPGSRLLACIGPLEAHKGFRDALWAFDILRFLYSDLHLLLIGTGSSRDRLREFAGVIGGAGQVHFLGERADVSKLFQATEVVWIPSRSAGGVNVALEAMAAGRPVVASRLPELAEIVVEGETGFLIPAGDKVALARQTRLLLEDRARRRRLGASGQQRVETHFAAADMVSRYARLYESMG